MLSAQTGDVHLIHDAIAVGKNKNKFDPKEKKDDFLKIRKTQLRR